MMSQDMLKRTADTIRILSAAMVEKAASGHPGGAMGGADFIAVLFSEFLCFDPDDMTWPNRDRFFLDPGHMSPMLYSTLMLLGKYTVDDIKNFRQWGSVTPGHPERDVMRGVENTSGPLGEGHSMALGAAIAERFFAARFGEWLSHKTYAYLSDGGIQEDIASGVGRLAGHLGLSNLIMFYDSNSVQLSTPTSQVTSEDTAKKYESWGWHVDTINGNSIAEILRALARANAETEKPTLIIGKTTMGLGALNDKGECFEGKVEMHGMPLSKAGASVEKTIRNLGGNPQDPFAVFPAVKDFFEKVLAQKRKAAKEKKAIQAKWEKENPALAEKFKNFISGKVPAIDYGAIEQKSGAPTRVASGKILSVFAQKVENMIVSSADLCNSDNTEGFLKGGSRVFTKGDFGGGFLQIGVAEHAMAGIMNGIALHGGIVPVCGTFFVFSDFMKPSIRLAALMKLPVKYVWSHDSFRVGEDGPTHQPVEHEMQIRLLERMATSDGKRSMLVLRPADSAETTVAWKLAMENTQSPTALLLSRQVMPELPVFKGPSRYHDACNAARGAYIVFETGSKPNLICIANGSEVSTLINAAQKLSASRGIGLRVVSVISDGLFREQPESYRRQLIPLGLPVFGITAGLSCSFMEIAGVFGKVHGLDRFGASAPFGVLEEKFGFTADSVVKKMELFLDEHKKNVAALSGVISA
ncbi:MAG TPA: transketolase [Chitinivibrionales bacterium]|nr:transketolase [Chitinivibrionales bacterium]